MLAELVAQIFPFVELVDLKLVLLCQLSYFLYNVVIICTGWLFFVQGGYFLDRWLFFCTGGYFLDRWLFFFAQRGYVFIMDTVILDILPK